MSQPAVDFARPTAADVDELAANMRNQDIDECLAAGLDDLRATVADGVRRSTMCWTARADGKLLAIFGCAPMGSLLSGVGTPWLLGTPELPRRRRILTAYARPYIDRMLSSFPHLVNVVHARNTVSSSWLRRMGFSLHPAAPYGPHGEPFHLFEMKRTNV